MLLEPSKQCFLRISVVAVLLTSPTGALVRV